MKKEIVTITNPSDKSLKQAIIELNAAIAKVFFYNCDDNFALTITPQIDSLAFFVIEHNAEKATFSLFDSVSAQYILIDRPASIKFTKIASRLIFIRTMCENKDFNIKSLDFEIVLTPADKF